MKQSLSAFWLLNAWSRTMASTAHQGLLKTAKLWMQTDLPRHHMAQFVDYFTVCSKRNVCFRRYFIALKHPCFCASLSADKDKHLADMFFAMPKQPYCCQNGFKKKGWISNACFTNFNPFFIHPERFWLCVLVWAGCFIQFSLTGQSEGSTLQSIQATSKHSSRSSPLLVSGPSGLDRLA